NDNDNDNGNDDGQEEGNDNDNDDSGSNDDEEGNDNEDEDEEKKEESQISNSHTTSYGSGPENEWLQWENKNQYNDPSQKHHASTSNSVSQSHFEFATFTHVHEMSKEIDRDGSEQAPVGELVVTAFPVDNHDVVDTKHTLPKLKYKFGNQAKTRERMLRKKDAEPVSQGHSSTYSITISNDTSEHGNVYRNSDEKEAQNVNDAKDNVREVRTKGWDTSNLQHDQKLSHSNTLQNNLDKNNEENLNWEQLDEQQRMNILLEMYHIPNVSNDLSVKWNFDANYGGTGSS
ncbi:Outer membrane protein/protective antigen OMA87, partial [Reticulomyxa filosa]